MFLRLGLLFACSLCFACTDGALAAQGKIPDVVEASLAVKYPGAKKVKWNRDRNNSHEAHFQLNGVKFRADFNPDGSWIETERSLDWKDLPDAVQAAIKAEYKKDDIVELELTDNAKKGEFYDVELDPKGQKKFDIEYRADGSKL
ncbi:MAG: PepSY-like domain-containing protein [Saprospiraceae bacterium]